MNTEENLNRQDSEHDRHALAVYEQLFTTWRSQVDSYWQRSAYFAAFETAAVAACWHLIETSHRRAPIFASILGLLLTLVWFLNNRAVRKYVLHWWSSLQDLEGKLKFHDLGFDYVAQHRGSGGVLEYHWIVQSVPIVFAIVWILLLLFGVSKLCPCHHL
jgi:hypothetical protein